MECLVPVTMVRPTPRIAQYPATSRNTTNFIPGRHQMSANVAGRSIANYSPPPSFGRNADLYNMTESELVNGLVRMERGRTYQVTKFLSRGTFGKTYKVWNPADKRYFAMKIVDHSSLERRATNMEEVRMLQTITRCSKDVHHLLRLIEYQGSEKTLLIVTELLHEDVARCMTRVAGPKCMCAVQSLAHQVIDYGSTVTKIRLSENRGCEELQTAAYRSPEVFLGLPLTEKIDVWSVGIMLIEHYTGTEFFKASNATSTLWAIAEITGVPWEFSRGFHSHKLIIPVPSEAGVYMFAKEEEINVKETWYRYPYFDAIYKFGTKPHDMRPIDQRFSNLLRLLLKPSASNRISAEEALRHPFFAEPFPIEN